MVLITLNLNRLLYCKAGDKNYAKARDLIIMYSTPCTQLEGEIFENFSTMSYHLLNNCEHNNKVCKKAKEYQVLRNRVVYADKTEQILFQD